MRSNPTLPRLFASALVVAYSLSIPSQARSGELETPPAASVDLSSIAIDNFGPVNEHYFRGSRPAEHDYTALAAIGIKTVIDLTGDDGDSREESLVKQAAMNYFHIPMNTRVAPTAEQVQQFLRIVNDPASQPVYVHCVGGRHRTGVMTAVYRISQDGWSADRAFKEMKQFKFGADFLHPEFKKFVYAYAPSFRVAARPPRSS